MKKLSCISFILVLFMVGCDDAAEPEITIEDDPIALDTTFSEIISDPAGDMRIGAAPDVISVHAKRTSTRIVFRVFFAEDVDMDSAVVILSLDTDKNPATGSSRFTSKISNAWNIGPDYDAIAILPRARVENTLYPPLTLLIFHNPNGTDLTAELTDAVSADSNMIEFAVPLSKLGNDDGNMDVAGLALHVAFDGRSTSEDPIPNTGHGTVGD